MPIDVSTDTIIERPIEVVSAYAADPANAPEWYRNIESATWQTAPPAQVGSRIAFAARFLGRRLEYVYEVVALEAGRRGTAGYTVRSAQAEVVARGRAVRAASDVTGPWRSAALSAAPGSLSLL
jgi:hypothetical protein